MQTQFCSGRISLGEHVDKPVARRARLRPTRPPRAGHRSRESNESHALLSFPPFPEGPRPTVISPSLDQAPRSLLPLPCPPISGPLLVDSSSQSALDGTDRPTGPHVIPLTAFVVYRPTPRAAPGHVVVLLTSSFRNHLRHGALRHARRPRGPQHAPCL